MRARLSRESLSNCEFFSILELLRYVIDNMVSNSGGNDPAIICPDVDIDAVAAKVGFISLLKLIVPFANYQKGRDRCFHKLWPGETFAFLKA